MDFIYYLLGISIGANVNFLTGIDSTMIVTIILVELGFYPIVKWLMA